MLYVISACDSGRLVAVKIGYTSGSGHERLKDLQTACPFDLVLVGVMPGEMEDEQHWHMAAKAHSRRGEWYHPAPELLEWLWGALASPTSTGECAPRPVRHMVPQVRPAPVRDLASRVIDAALRGQRS